MAPLTEALRSALHALPAIDRARLVRELDLALSSRNDPSSLIANIFTDEQGEPFSLAPFHRDLQAFLSENPHALVELPRDHGKSTQVCGRILWELGHNPNLRVKIVCATDAIAAERSRFLRTTIATNGRLRLAFPSLRPASPWGADAFTVQRTASIIGPSVAAFGVGAGSTGTRADLLVCDDIVDVRALHSKTDRDRVRDDFQHNLMNLLEPNGRFWGLFTPWHADDLNAHLVKNAAYPHFRRAIDADLTPLWPEKWPQERLAARRQEVGASSFARGYHLKPQSIEDAPIRPEWVQTWTLQADRYDRIVMAVDPAVATHANADRSAVAVLGLLRSEDASNARSSVQIHVLEAVARRVSAPDLITFLDEIDRRWNPEVILFESNAAFEGMRSLFAKTTRFGPKLQAVVQTRDKASRVAAFSVPIENGVVRLKGEGRTIDASQHLLHDEMTTFPSGTHDDLLDAAAMGTAFLLNRREPRVWG